MKSAAHSDECTFALAEMLLPTPHLGKATLGPKAKSTFVLIDNVELYFPGSLRFCSVNKSVDNLAPKPTTTSIRREK
jgi:hypothetical protein